MGFPEACLLPVVAVCGDIHLFGDFLISYFEFHIVEMQRSLRK